MKPLTRCFTLSARAFHNRSIFFAEMDTLTRLRAQERIAATERERPFSPALIDSFHRRHNYLRISLTEKCNLRCFYCMPEAGIDLAPREHILTNDEVVRLATLFVNSGVTKIRLTGGEPTVRKGITDIIGKIAQLGPLGVKSIGMTSNGLALHRRLPEMVEKGLTHLNLSLDTLDPMKFELITRRSGHGAVLKSLDVALESRLQGVKLNVVVVKALNEDEILDFVELTRDRRLSVRFIEYMPFSGNTWDKSKVVPSSEILARIMFHYPHTQKITDEQNDTARSYAVPGFCGSFGFISSMSDHFCSTCNRLRLTADGQIKVCLFDAKEVSLRDAMRAGASDEELLSVIGMAVAGKNEKHAGMEDIDVVFNRPMIKIGVKVNSPLTGSEKGLASWNPLPRRQRVHPQTRRLYSSNARRLEGLTHLDREGRPSMVNVSSNPISHRLGEATGRIYIPPHAFGIVSPKSSPPSDSDSQVEGPATPERVPHVSREWTKSKSKGDILSTAQLAAIMACKKTSEIIPLCHPLLLDRINVTLTPHTESSSLECRVIVECQGRTGVEMEALVGVMAGLGTVWDMLKAVAGREMKIYEVMVVKKFGGSSGDFQRSEKQA